jgi:hypothetical protein
MHLKRINLAALLRKLPTRCILYKEFVVLIADTIIFVMHILKTIHKSNWKLKDYINLQSYIPHQ